MLSSVCRYCCYLLFGDSFFETHWEEVLDTGKNTNRQNTTGRMSQVLKDAGRGARNGAEASAQKCRGWGSAADLAGRGAGIQSHPK